MTSVLTPFFHRYKKYDRKIPHIEHHKHYNKMNQTGGTKIAFSHLYLLHPFIFIHSIHIKNISISFGVKICFHGNEAHILVFLSIFDLVGSPYNHDSHTQRIFNENILPDSPINSVRVCW